MFAASSSGGMPPTNAVGNLQIKKVSGSLSSLVCRDDMRAAVKVYLTYYSIAFLLSLFCFVGKLGRSDFLVHTRLQPHAHRARKTKQRRLLSAARLTRDSSCWLSASHCPGPAWPSATLMYCCAVYTRRSLLKIETSFQGTTV